MEACEKSSSCVECRFKRLIALCPQFFFTMNNSLRKRKEPFNWKKQRYCQYLLKIMYIGTNYSGLAWQPFDADKESTLSTVEGALFRALKKTCLIPSRRLANFSRCGRTDKGVHAAGNYVSLKLRQLPVNSNDSENPYPYFHYAKVLNAVLPQDIRVIDCVPVESSFDARFKCLYRVYKYYFFNENFDINRMRDSSQLFVGTHDFRNFCKIDGDKKKNYTRTLLWVKLNPIFDSLMWEIEVAGLSFLWQQIRRMVGILFLIGKHEILPESISEFLDVNQNSKPTICHIASHDGLVLYDCFFEGVHFKSPKCALKGFQDFFSKKLQSLIVLGCLCDQLWIFRGLVGDKLDGEPDGENSKNSIPDQLEPLSNTLKYNSAFF